jgi:hypothetical protein
MRASGASRPLFNSADWLSVEQHQRRKMIAEIDASNGNRLLNTSVDDMCAYVEGKYRIDVPILHEDLIVVDQREVQIDMSQDRMRDIRDRSRRFNIAGTRLK